MATGPFLMWLPGPQVLSWIGFIWFATNNRELIERIAKKNKGADKQISKLYKKADEWKAARKRKKALKNERR